MLHLPLATVPVDLAVAARRKSPSTDYSDGEASDAVSGLASDTRLHTDDADRRAREFQRRAERIRYARHSSQWLCRLPRMTDGQTTSTHPLEIRRILYAGQQ